MIRKGLFLLMNELVHTELNDQVFLLQLVLLKIVKHAIHLALQLNQNLEYLHSGDSVIRVQTVKGVYQDCILNVFLNLFDESVDNQHLHQYLLYLRIK